jgi:lipid-A-disaccharide synthase
MRTCSHNPQMKYYIIAGEASGDLHASNLMKEIRMLDPDAIFRCWGGDLMEEQGGEIVKHFRDLAFMGFWEVLINLRTILGNFKFCERDILSFNPDVVILVDYPGFNLRIAEFASKNNLKVFYYISPQLWAWRSSRVKKIRKFVDKMFVILPFEKDFYKDHNYDVEFVGHPLLDVLQNDNNVTREDFLSRNSLPGKPVIALLPGSRRQEIKVMLGIMLQVIPDFPDFQFVVAGAPSVPPEFYREIIRNTSAGIVFGQTRELLRNSEAALVTSGTATLETALLGIPEVVCYKGNVVSYLVARQIVHVAFISLVNLIMGREVVTELIQGDLTRENLLSELKQVLTPQKRAIMERDYNQLRQKLGGAGASQKAAGLIVQYLKKT